jgi:ligand-binding sensor domain-containing protein
VLRNSRLRWITVVIGSAAMTLAGLGFVRWRVLKALTGSEQQVASEQRLRFVVRHLPENANSKFDRVSASAAFSQAAEFQGRLYLCGSAGLYEYGADGKLEQEYHVGKELPSSPLTQMVTAVLPDSARPELVIATKSEGLVAFNGSSFRQIRPADSAAREITSLLPLDSGQLLIGTSKEGVLAYDGKRLGPFHPTLSAVHVTEVAGDQSDLWIGTIDQGVLHWHGGQADSFGEAEGLPDPQVLSLLVAGERVFVGTPLGVAEFRQGRLQRVIARGAFAQSLAVMGETLVIGTLDQGIARVSLAADPPPTGMLHSAQDIDAAVQIFKSGDFTYALASQGLYQLGERGGAGRELFRTSDAVLTDANVSALSVDAKGNLWVGYFNRGLDVIDPAGRRRRHVEDDYVFCVNRIVPARTGAAMAVGTANGLVLFDADANERQVLTSKDGLIADDVTDLAVDPDGMTIATPAGITFLGADGARSLYAFQGLVNNHVYTLGVSGRELLAGTLGGISVLDRGQIAGSYTTANSGLKQNWISAVVRVGQDWMVGTYGGGIVRLDDSGRFHSYPVATDRFEVNPNAMLVTEQHVFAGSLAQGLYVYDRGTDRWSELTAGLPSENVTALSESNGYIYIGTDNGLVRAREEDLQP